MAVIAIDGPAGAGKSTVAKQVAMSTNLPYLDTGAMYRCVAHAVMQSGVNMADAEAVGIVAANALIVVEQDSAELNGVDVSAVIRTPEVSSVVSIIAAHSPVRDAMRSQQRTWVENHGGGVVEGRDIGTVVFPRAQLKIFLTASPEVRAQRRVSQTGGDVHAIASNIAERDRIDSTRSDSPLRPAEDSILVDSSNRSITEVVNEIVHHFQQKQKAL
ncbi:MAG: (d)CMP kinase [Actinomycetes bacterium]